MIVVGVDPSLTATGLAMVGAGGVHEPDWVTRTVRSKRATARPGVNATAGQALRMRAIAREVAAFSVGADLAVVEGMAIRATMSGFRDLSGLWWAIVAELVGSGVPVEVLSPKARAKYATGDGNAGKDEVLEAVRAAYPSADVAGHDEGDAVACAAFGARLRGVPVELVLQPRHEEVLAAFLRPPAVKKRRSR